MGAQSGNETALPNHRAQLVHMPYLAGDAIHQRIRGALVRHTERGPPLHLQVENPRDFAAVEALVQMVRPHLYRGRGDHYRLHAGAVLRLLDGWIEDLVADEPHNGVHPGLEEDFED